jgi:hypothetical protein
MNSVGLLFCISYLLLNICRVGCWIDTIYLCYGRYPLYSWNSSWNLRFSLPYFYFVVALRGMEMEYRNM